MARHGENIRKRKDGRWEGRYPAYNAEKGKKIYQSVYAQTYDEVHEKLVARKKELSADNTLKTVDPVSDARFSDMAEQWLTETENKRKRSTYIKYHTIYYTHIEPYFTDAAVLEVTDAFVAEKIPSGLSASVYKSIYCVLNQILKFSFRQYGFPVYNLQKPDIYTRKKSVKILTQNEQKALISVLYQKMDIYKMAILMCLFTGLRLGELCALKWTDVDFNNKTLIVNRTVQRLPVEGQKTKTVLMETIPKSECSKREIPLPDNVCALLKMFQNGSEYIFGANAPLEPRVLQYHFKKILAEAGLENKNFHILRHTFSTNCIEGGVDVKSLSEMLGHSNVQITLNCYVHPSMDTKRQCMNGLSKFYGQICGITSL